MKNAMKNTVFLPALAMVMVLGGGIAGYAHLAAAQDATTSGQGRPAGFDHMRGGHVGKNGTKEEPLTGDVAAKVTAAALAAQPGATVERVETDAEGAAYEAHMTATDGSRLTLKFDTNFTVTATENGRGPR